MDMKVASMTERISGKTLVEKRGDEQVSLSLLRRQRRRSVCITQGQCMLEIAEIEDRGKLVMKRHKNPPQSQRPSLTMNRLDSWFYGDGFSTLAKLREHKKVVTGIALPAGSNKLFSGSTDGTVRIWDCRSGQCVNVINLGAQVTSLISEGPWVFVGLRNAVKAWNTQTASEFTLDGPKGQVLAMTVGNDTLFAGAEDGVISAWRGSSETRSVEPIASLRGHTKAVVCLTVGCMRLYSGSMDHSIKVWDLNTLECKMTLDEHTDVVTSLICWDNYLLSSSYDCTIKVWGATEEGTLKVTYTHTEEKGVLALCGMTVPDDKHILFCSCRDKSVGFYELPSFSEMGRLFARKEVQSFEIGPGGLLFTGDGTGLLTVCKWLDKAKGGILLRNVPFLQQLILCICHF